MTGPEKETEARVFWFGVGDDIPEMGAYPADIVIREGGEVWVCKQIPIEWFMSPASNRLTPWPYSDPLPRWAAAR